MLLSAIPKGGKGGKWVHSLVFIKHYCVRLLVNVFPRNTSSPSLLWTKEDGQQKSQSEVVDGTVFVLVEYSLWKRNKVGKAGWKVSGFIQGEIKISQKDANNNERATKGVEMCNHLGKKYNLQEKKTTNQSAKPIINHKPRVIIYICAHPVCCFYFWNVRFHK